MKLNLAMAAALFTLCAGVAQARDVVTATLETPVARAERVVAASLVWSCEGSSCAAVSRTKPAVRDCRALAREVGRVSAFGTEEAKLEGAEIEACNARARVVAAAE